MLTYMCNLHNSKNFVRNDLMFLDNIVSVFQLQYISGKCLAEVEIYQIDTWSTRWSTSPAFRPGVCSCSVVKQSKMGPSDYALHTYLVRAYT
jgi:hypothetical protein